MLDSIGHLITDFYTTLRKVSFPENLGQPFEESEAEKLVKFYNDHQLRNFVTLKSVSVEQFGEWYMLWVTTEFSSKDAVSGCFKDVAILVYWDMRSHAHSSKKVRDLFDLWMIYECEIGE